MSGAVILSINDVVAKTSMCKSTIYSRIKAGKFPGSITLFGRRAGWIQSEVDAWIEERRADRDRSAGIAG
jgi:prophage regulatory protein